MRLLLLLPLVAASVRFKPRNDTVRDMLQPLQARPGKRTRNVVARNPNKKRDSIYSPGVPIHCYLVVSGSSGTIGYVVPAASGTGRGDYSVSNGLVTTNAVIVSITPATTDVQQLPILNGSPEYPYLAGAVGAQNAGAAGPPYIPSQSLGGYNYLTLTNAPAQAYGPPSFAPNADNQNPYVETGMFILSGVGLTQVLPYWQNPGGSTTSGQQWALDFLDNLVVVTDYGAYSGEFTTGTGPVVSRV